MSRDFTKVSPRVWRSRRFRTLTDDAKQLLLFLLTCDHQTSAGCFRMPDAYGAADLLWAVERMQAARSALVEAGLVVFDDRTEEYFVCGWFAYSRPMNVSHQKSIDRQVENIESDAVRAAALKELAPSLVANSVATHQSNERLAASLKRMSG